MDFSSIESAEKKVLRQGYLKKIPNKNKFGASFKKWERRFFVFCTVNGSPCLEYYESEDNFLRRESPMNLLWLATTQYVIQALADEKHENMFNIGMTDRILSLIAPTRDEMESWCQTLESHLARLGIIEAVEDRYATFPVASQAGESTEDNTPLEFRKPSNVRSPSGLCKPFDEQLDLKKPGTVQPSHVALPPVSSNVDSPDGDIGQEFEDIVEAKEKAKREFEASETARKASGAHVFEDIAEAKAKAKRDFEAGQANASPGEQGESDTCTAVKASTQERTISECSSGSDQVFEEAEAAKKQVQARMASLGSDPNDANIAIPRPIPTTRALPIPAPRSSPIAPPRKTSVDEIDLIKAQNRRKEQQQIGTSPLRDPRSPLPPLPPLPPIPDEDLKKTKSALEPPEKPGANLEKSPRSRRHLEQQLAAANGRAEENLYEPPRPGFPPDFPIKPPPPPPTQPGMRRHSGPDLQQPVDTYGAVWNENLPPTLPEKRRGSKQLFERQGSRNVRVLSDEERQPHGGSSSSEPPPLPGGRPTGPPPSRSNSVPYGPAPMQAAGTFDPDAMKNLLESSNEFNRSLLEHAKDRGLTPIQPSITSPVNSSILRTHSVVGIKTSPAANITLKEREVDNLRQEINHAGGVRVQLRKKDCCTTLAFIDLLDAAWVVGWNQKASPFLHNAFHIGDRILSVNGQDVIDSEHAQKLIRHSPGDMKVEFVVKRTPYASVYAIKRSAEGESLGFKRESGTAEIYQVSPDGLAARHGLPMQACSLDGVSPCHWVLTEINNRPLNLFFKDKEIEHRLNAVGKDISIMVQPYDFISAIKKLLKKTKGYKDFIVQ